MAEDIQDRETGDEDIGACARHPDRPGRYVCQKHNVRMCAECKACRDPKIYCKFRPSCPIWFERKKPLD